MAQTNYTPISLYYSTTASQAPTAGNLVNGELAINITDGKLYYKDNTGAVKVIAGSGGTGIVAGSNTQIQFNNNGVFGASSGMTWDGTNLTASQLRSSGLTSGRVTYASTSGLLVDSANMTFNGTLLTVADFADSSLTSGRVTYATTGGNLTDSANLTFNGTTLTAGGLTTTGTTSTGVLSVTGNTTLGDASADTVTVNGTITSNLIFTDNTYDIGASGATRPRSLFLGTNLTAGGSGTFVGNVAINSTPVTWADASALTVHTYAAYGSRNIGNSDGVISWNAQWSGGASGAGYTYRRTGDVASSYEQNGSHRFYTNPTPGTAGAGIAFPVRLAISADGYTYIGYQGSALANLNILTGGAGGGIQLNRNTSGTPPTVGQSFGQYAWKGTDSANTNNAAEAMIEAYAAENFTGSTAATNLAFYTKPSGVGPGSAPTLRGGINSAGQWIFGNSVSPDGNARLTLYTGNGTNEGLSIYETSTGNNARLRVYQASAAVFYDATYSSGGNSHNFQIGSGTAFSVNSGVAVLGSSSPLSWFGGNVLQGPSFAINQVAGVDQTAYVTGAYQPTYVGSWLARGAYRASMYQQISGGHAFFTNGTTPGGAGSTVSFTQAVTIDSNGFVGINQASPTTYLEIGGSGEMLRLDGSPGTNRSIYLRNVGSGTATLFTDGTLNLASNAAYAINLQTQSTSRVRVTSDGNMFQLTGRKSNAYTMGNMQEWVGSVTSIANGVSFSLFTINNIYDNLCYELSMFVNAGGFFAYKSAGVFGYNGFTNTVLGASTSQTITRTGALFNETMTITNNQGATVNQYIICLRVWGLSQGQSVSSGGQDCVTSSYLTRIQ